MDNIQNYLTCKNKKTGEITICSSMCLNMPYEEENGMYICEGNEKCNRSVLYRVEQADLDKLNKYAKRFELSGRRLYIYENGITLLDVRPFVKDGKAVIPKPISSIDEEAKGNLQQITSLEVPPSSWRNITARIRVMTTLSLSMGATFETLPIWIAL